MRKGQVGMLLVLAGAFIFLYFFFSSFTNQKVPLITICGDGVCQTSELLLCSSDCSLHPPPPAGGANGGNNNSVSPPPVQPPAPTPPPVPPPPVTPPPIPIQTQGTTSLSIQGSKLYINGQITHSGKKIEGSVITVRAANAIFDTTIRPEFFNDFSTTAEGKVWSSNNAVYGTWSADANTDRLVVALPSWRAKGIRSISLNMQGGCSCSRNGEDGMVLSGGGQTPNNNPYLKDASGNLYVNQAYLNRLEKVVRAADGQGMIVFVGVLYFGQDGRLPNSADRLKAAELMANWVLDKGFTNVVLETKNENQDQQSLDMIAKIHQVASSRGKTLYAATSLGYQVQPTDAYLQAVDLVLVHTNGYGSTTPNSGGYSVYNIIDSIRARSAYKGNPILITEDDHASTLNNMNAAADKGIGWGYYNDREKQSVPANWNMFSSNDQNFINNALLITGGT